ncbi:hypothetical protein M9980_01685 [Sphingomonas donggukensis]|uniref:TonB-dependent receptor n=2 Tax=Sphingomonas donggukensis TaxID=2949093 RepID=A0ABY4TXM3_9SPHN|nr:hypothetical protein [Sphingomonas donggukensis]URW77103.1 hypothetical protein M9980_01685 [Sphingomonas donggukensis]
MSRFLLLAAVAAGAFVAFPAAAQHMHMPMPAPNPAPAAGPSQADQPAPMTHDAHQDHEMTAVDDAAMGHDMGAMNMGAMRMGDACAAFGSGTALLPLGSGMMTGQHIPAGNWDLMAHGYVWGAYTDQSGPRGDDMAFVQSMAMLTADRELGSAAHLQLRSMLSLEPLMGRRGYPNLLATGETAFGRPLVDRQHPHDLFMELAARVDLDIGEDTRAFLYGGPVGEPALGPAAFMHRPSSRYMPLAPITHHWFDSTHITYGVVTAGVRAKVVQVEASAFRGREPDEARWNIETPALDSWSVRATWTPSPNWVAQVSHGRLKEPEAQHPGEDEGRTTASVHYGDRRLAATLAWSAKNRIPGETLTAWLAEANWNPAGGHNLFARAENVANDELFPDHADPLHDVKFRVSRVEGGYAYRLPIAGPLNVALGGSVLATAVPDALQPRYGSGTGYTLFAKLSLDN